MLTVQYKNIESVAFTVAHRSIIVLPGGDTDAVVSATKTAWAAGTTEGGSLSKLRFEFQDAATFAAARTALLSRIPKDKVSAASSVNGLYGVSCCPRLAL